MKLKLLLSLWFGFSIFAKAENDPPNLVIWAKDGTKVAYALAERPKVTFTETDLVITTNDVEVNYSLEKMARFTFEEDVSATIRNPQKNETSFKLDGEYLLFSTLNTNSTLFIYSLNGVLVYKKVVSHGKHIFPLSNLPKGTYLVIINGITYKITKK